jgi:hypothetical protein
MPIIVIVIIIYHRYKPTDLASGFPANILYAVIFFPILATCPTRFILFHLKIPLIFDEEYKLCSYSLCSLFHSPVTSSLFGWNILLSTLFSNTLSVCPSLNVRDQVSQSQLLFCVIRDPATEYWAQEGCTQLLHQQVALDKSNCSQSPTKWPKP